MTNQNNPENFYFASCPRGTEDLLKSEMNKYKLDGKVTKGGVSFKGTDKDALNFLLNTRIASRVFKEVHCFYIKAEKQIYMNGRNIKWDTYLGTRDTFKITTLLDRDAKNSFKNSIFLSQLLKDSLVDHMRSKVGKRPDVDTKEPTISFLQRIETTKKDFKVLIYLDLTGRSLDKRGYRQTGHLAPLRENLAAAIVMTTDWKSEKEKYFDPMVGSGTLLIEAILYKERIAPSYLTLKYERKPYAFQRQLWYKESNLVKWFDSQINDVLTKSKEKIENMKSGFFFANDIDEDNIKLCKKHLRKCFGRIDFVEFSNEDFINSNDQETQHDLIVFNPPYGERLAKNVDIDALYHEIGETLKNKYPNSRAYIFTLHGDLRKNIRLKPTLKKEFFNGDLDCRLFRYVID